MGLARPTSVHRRALRPIGRVDFAPTSPKVKSSGPTRSSPATGARTWCCCSRRRATQATTCASLQPPARAPFRHGAGCVAGQARTLTWVAEWHRPGRNTQGGRAGQATCWAKTNGTSWHRIEMTPRFLVPPSARPSPPTVKVARSAEPALESLGGPDAHAEVKDTGCCCPGSQLRRWTAKP